MGPDRDRPLDLKSDTHLQPDASPTALRGPAHLKTEVRNEKSVDYLQRVVKKSGTLADKLQFSQPSYREY